MLLLFSSYLLPRVFGNKASNEEQRTVAQTQDTAFADQVPGKIPNRENIACIAALDASDEALKLYKEIVLLILDEAYASAENKMRERDQMLTAGYTPASQECRQHINELEEALAKAQGY